MMLSSYLLLLPILIPRVLFTVIGILIGFSLPFLATSINKYKLNKYDREYDIEHEYKGYLPFITALLLSVFVFIATFIYSVPIMIPVFIFLSLAIVVTLVDMKIRLIPNEIVIGIFVLGILFRFLEEGVTGLLNSFIAFLIVLGLLLLTSAVTFLIRRTFGAGAGDLKLMAVIAVAAGIPGVLYFLIGMSVALIIYVIYGTLTKKLTLGSAFPMSGPIMAGFVYYLLHEIIPFF